MRVVCVRMRACVHMRACCRLRLACLAWQVSSLGGSVAAPAALAKAPYSQPQNALGVGCSTGSTGSSPAQGSAIPQQAQHRGVPNSLGACDKGLKVIELGHIGGAQGGEGARVALRLWGFVWSGCRAGGVGDTPLVPVPQKKKKKEKRREYAC